ADYEKQFDTYFCDPYCSWQKGLVENTNKLLRQYLPRNIPSELLTQDSVDEVVVKLNSRPRKTLGYSTPAVEFKIRSV
ncbi:MAG: IS30 family transposase, partial [Patescibacteria group bacterium]